MCEFLSWIRKLDGSVLYLTHHQIYETKKGKLLREWDAGKQELTGHGAIRFYYGLNSREGQDCECTDFSTPDNFPGAIADAVKRGEFAGLGMPLQLLSTTAQEEYDRLVKPAQEEYDRIVKPAWAEYDRIVEAARAEYDRIVEAARAEYDRLVKPALWGLFALPENRARAWK